MSLTSWKKEFYPDIDSASASWIECAEHALNKWKGAREENLKKHNVRFSNLYLSDPIENEAIQFISSTCALCNKSDLLEEGCYTCPIYEMRGISCDGNCYDEIVVGSEPNSNEYEFVKARSGNIEPMIELLEKTVIFLKKE